jgi:hypothetical protein
VRSLVLSLGHYSDATSDVNDRRYKEDHSRLAGPWVIVDNCICAAMAVVASIEDSPAS